MCDYRTVAFDNRTFFGFTWTSERRFRRQRDSVARARVGQFAANFRGEIGVDALVGSRPSRLFRVWASAIGPASARLRHSMAGDFIGRSRTGFGRFLPFHSHSYAVFQMSASRWVTDHLNRAWPRTSTLRPYIVAGPRSPSARSTSKQPFSCFTRMASTSGPTTRFSLCDWQDREKP